MKNSTYEKMAREYFPENVVKKWLDGDPLFSVIGQFLVDAEEHGFYYEITQEPYATIIKPLLKEIDN